MIQNPAFEIYKVKLTISDELSFNFKRGKFQNSQILNIYCGLTAIISAKKQITTCRSLLYYKIYSKAYNIQITIYTEIQDTNYFYNSLD